MGENREPKTLSHMTIRFASAKYHLTKIQIVLVTISVVLYCILIIEPLLVTYCSVNCTVLYTTYSVAY